MRKFANYTEKRAEKLAELNSDPDYKFIRAREIMIVFCNEKEGRVESFQHPDGSSESVEPTYYNNITEVRKDWDYLEKFARRVGATYISLDLGFDAADSIQDWDECYEPWVDEISLVETLEPVEVV